MSAHEHEWQLVEDGYQRVWSTVVDLKAGTVTAVESEFSDDGDGVYLSCECGAVKDTAGLQIRWW